MFPATRPLPQSSPPLPSSRLARRDNCSLFGMLPTPSHNPFYRSSRRSPNPDKISSNPDSLSVLAPKVESPDQVAPLLAAAHHSGKSPRNGMPPAIVDPASL